MGGPPRRTLPRFGPGFDFIAGIPELVGLGPSLTYRREGYLEAPTFPQPLRVTISRAGAQTFVAIAEESPALEATGGGVTIPGGSTSAAVQLSGSSPSSAVTLTATLAGVSQTATVRVLGPTEVANLATVTPANATVWPSDTIALSIHLDRPAPPGGTVVSLSVSPPTAGSLPATVTVPADALSAGVEYLDTSGLAATVTASDGTQTASANLAISGLVEHLIINEVDYDMVGATDGHEFIELYNPAADIGRSTGGPAAQFSPRDPAPFRRRRHCPTTRSLRRRTGTR